ELAKTLGLSSKALIDKLRQMKVDVQSHMSVVPEEAVRHLKEETKKKSVFPKVAEKEPVEKAAVPKKKPKELAVKVEKPILKAEKAVKALEKPVVKHEVPKPQVPPPAAKPVPPAAKPVPPRPVGVVPKVPEAPQEIQVPSKPKTFRTVQLRYPVTVKELSVKIGVKSNELIKALIQRKIFATINQALDESVVMSLAEEFGILPEKLPTTEETLLFEHDAGEKANLQPRAPIVTLMGHVDHGKTSLLDAIRETHVAAGEAGAITQHIGAYEVALGKGRVTFLDTPGHEAFTAMRARGANVTDIVVLVVAADDGVMPQTLEAIDHARAADVPIVVAINKCDLPTANMDRVKQQLTEKELVSEEWGGKTIMVPVSAKTQEGIPNLLEMLLLEAELLELKANLSKRAKGVVVESELSKGKGPIATVLIQDGILRIGDVVVCGLHYGKVRAMLNDKGQRVHEALPSQPVEILGLSGVPEAGDRFYAVQDEKLAKQIISERQEQRPLKSGAHRHLTLEDLHNMIQEGKIKEVKFILKADVQGSLEALKSEISKIDSEGIRLVTIHEGLGDINESDIMLAAASDALVLGFHVGELPRAEAVAREEEVEVKQYNIIYEAVSEIKLAIEGLLEPVTREVFLGRAEVKQVFKITKVGNIAGCLSVKGRLVRAGNPMIRVVRNKETVFEGKLAALKRFKDDVKEVTEGQECGISIEGFKDFQAGDWIEFYQVEKVAQKLGASSKG
ncbi:MAG: translation initiation factor IF-2, partial [Candidatus Omnitrophota bacterium]